jgi:3',5'-cyclic AMP phosphodiesterase CpdA
MRFVILGDLHYSHYGIKLLATIREEFFLRIFQTVKSIKPDVVFAIGDVSHHGRINELEGLRQVARRAGVEHYYMVNGNHDLIRLRPAEVVRHNYNEQAGYFALHFNQRGQIVDKDDQEGWPFLLLDTSQQSKHLDTSGHVPQPQLDWLEQQIAQVPATKTLVVLGHHPLRGLTKWANMRNMSINNSDDVWKVLAKHQGPGFYFCGHNHNNSEARRDNWLAIQTAAPYMSLNFRLVELTPQGLKSELVQVEGSLEIAKRVRLLKMRFAIPDL